MGRQIIKVTSSTVWPLPKIHSRSWIEYLHQLFQRPQTEWIELTHYLEQFPLHAMYNAETQTLGVFTNGSNGRLHVTEYLLQDVLFQLTTSVNTLYWFHGGCQ